MGSQGLACTHLLFNLVALFIPPLPLLLDLTRDSVTNNSELGSLSVVVDLLCNIPSATDTLGSQGTLPTQIQGPPWCAVRGRRTNGRCLG